MYIHTHTYTQMRGSNINFLKWLNKDMPSNIFLLLMTTLLVLFLIYFLVTIIHHILEKTDIMVSANGGLYWQWLAVILFWCEMENRKKVQTTRKRSFDLSDLEWTLPKHTSPVSSEKRRCAVGFDPLCRREDNPSRWECENDKWLRHPSVVLPQLPLACQSLSGLITCQSSQSPYNKRSHF